MLHYNYISFLKKIATLIKDVISGIMSMLGFSFMGGVGS